MTRVAKLTGYLLAVFIALAVIGCSLLPSTEKASPAQSLNAIVPTRVSSNAVAPARPSTHNATMQIVRLLIPSIQVDASIESVGVLPNGELETPLVKPWDDVGWYQTGPVPGHRGSAVIDGHLDRPGGYSAVFWRLRELHAGDAVIVMNAQGKAVHFHVTQVAFYAPQAAPLQEIFGNGGGAFLNLITCAGDWIPDQHQTTQRLVVYTALG
jgi:sortase (surface protein transpeptidase)